MDLGRIETERKTGGEPLHGNGEPLSYGATFLVPPQER
jgi:hypothetical protein